MTTAVAETLRAVLSLAIGLLLGSVLPADLLARRRDIDIRSVGDGNPGTVNAFLGLGRAAGLITLVYDISVGVVAIELARLLGVSEGVAYLAGIMTIVGHRFPVFSRFRGGGQGMATSAGMIIYGAGVAFSLGWLSVWDFALLAAIAAVAYALTRSATVIGLAILPVFVIELVVGSADWQFIAFMAAVATNIWIVQVIVTLRTSPSGVLRPARGQPRR